MLRYLTAGESHGKCLMGIIEGFPANVPIDIEMVNTDLRRRQKGYGRGGRMEIEKDEIEILSGVRGGKTLGSPIAFRIANRDYENWERYMNPLEVDVEGRKVTKPRPGHGDLAGAIKYGFHDIRNVLERSSARETAVRTAIGSIAKQLLLIFGIAGVSHVTAIGGVSLREKIEDFERLKMAEQSSVHCVDPLVEQKMIQEIERAKSTGDSLGGVFEIHIKGAPVGLGSYVHWDRKLDARLAQGLMSIQGIKGIEVGWGFVGASLQGSQVHDEIFYNANTGYYRESNRAGGIEGGMSNGENIVLRCAMKPIPTLYKPLKSVDIETKEPFVASVERSDTCAVPSAAIVGEMVALTIIAEEFLKKFGGDSLEEIEERWKNYKSI
ncbi:chorismate synthase [Anaerosolibacter carboniphilus]|uniref:Chorismate synthase n=1 Tax=Anaerosolibacter carboniphilus TaxID=1417629 RepID=A0A841KWL3_9FIRM|nr:chorismate synthase [Anaerosolibacter carboniphilus]MBB6218076.1 chorismate synthase [Anaerosolibacter carboniphilus]